MQNELISRIIGAMTRSEEGQKQFAIWDWFQGVGLYGLYRCAKATGDKEAERFVKNWFDDQIARQRIEKAKKLLSATDKPMKEIAALCGFCNAGYFTNAFRSSTGVTPKVWRLRPESVRRS